MGLSGCTVVDQVVRTGLRPKPDFVIAPLPAMSDRRGNETTSWAVVHLTADPNDLDGAVDDIARTESECVVVRELTPPVRPDWAPKPARPVPPLFPGAPELQRTFAIESIAGESGYLTFWAEPIEPKPTSGGSHRITLRATLSGAAGMNPDRAGLLVQVIAERMADLAGVEIAPVR